VILPSFFRRLPGRSIYRANSGLQPPRFEFTFVTSILKKQGKMKTTINSITKKAILITIAIFGLGIYSIAATNGPEILMNANASLVRITQNLSPSTPSEDVFPRDCIKVKQHRPGQRYGIVRREV
jgi:hypothetical protein